MRQGSPSVFGEVVFNLIARALQYAYESCKARPWYPKGAKAQKEDKTTTVGIIQELSVRSR